MPTEREVSLPFASPSRDAGARPAERPELADLRRRAAALLEGQAGDIAARWEAQVRPLVPTLAQTVVPSTTDDVSGSPPVTRVTAIVHSLAAVLASGGTAAEDAQTLGTTIGATAFGAGAPLHQLLRALDLLEAMCLATAEEAVDDDASRPGGVAEGVRLSRHLRQATAAIMLAAAQGYAQAADDALQERFRRLRHDLRNPLGTIRSALELMADESIPEEARRSPRFRAMVERNTAALDQMIVSRLSDAEAHLMRTLAAPAGRGEGTSVPLGRSEPRDDLGGARQGEDRQTGSL